MGVPTFDPSANPTLVPTAEPTKVITSQPSALPSISQSPTTCVGKVNVCFALDMSGSICSPDQSNPQSCYNCPDQCHEEDLFGRDTCCSNFGAMKSFSSAMLDTLAVETLSAMLEQPSIAGLSNGAFSVVEFAAKATEIIGLSSSSKAMQELKNLVY